MRPVVITSVLVVEDEALVALQIEDMVREMGAANVHICSTVASAIDVARSADLDCALLDVMLPDGTGDEVADILEARGVPFVFSTGSGTEAVSSRHSRRPCLNKPFADDDLKQILFEASQSA